MWFYELKNKYIDWHILVYITHKCLNIHKYIYVYNYVNWIFFRNWHILSAEHPKFAKKIRNIKKQPFPKSKLWYISVGVVSLFCWKFKNNNLSMIKFAFFPRYAREKNSFSKIYFLIIFSWEILNLIRKGKYK